MAEQKTKTPYWTKRIAAARKRGFFTSEENSRANGWTTCACGKQDRRIPRYATGDEDAFGRPRTMGEPKDDKLLRLGADFSYAVVENEFGDAERILAAIEARAAIVIAKAEAAR